MNDLLTLFNQYAEKIIANLNQELRSFRTSRASSGLIENIEIEAYPGQPKLKLYELATITNDGPSILVISPFDPSVIKAIEKELQKTNLGATPQTQANRIILRLPPLSSEQRQQYLKLLNQIIEKQKNNLRNYRDEIRKKIRLSFQDKQLTEDEKFRLEKEINEKIVEFSEQIQSIKLKKEEEITSFSI